MPPSNLAPDLVGLILGALISSTVIGSVIGGLINFAINKRNARITERKNTHDESNDLVGRYREAAAEERAAKESAVRTVKDLLAIAETQISTLQDTISRLTRTIEILQLSAVSQQELINDLIADRNHLQEELQKAEKHLSEQKQGLITSQRRAMQHTETSPIFLVKE